MSGPEPQNETQQQFPVTEENASAEMRKVKEKVASGIFNEGKPEPTPAMRFIRWLAKTGRISDWPTEKPADSKIPIPPEVKK